MKIWNINKKYLLAALSASIGSGFQHGYHHGLVNIAHENLLAWIRLNKKSRYKKLPSEEESIITWSVVVSIFPVGGMLGSSMTAYFASRFGHKGGLIWNNVIMFLAALFLLFAPAADLYEVFIIGRFLIGINAGLNSGLCPIYLAEIAPLPLRGSTTALYSLVVTMSYCISHVLSLNRILGVREHWFLLVGVTLIPATLQLLVLFICPESPRYHLITFNDEVKTTEALKWFRSTDDIDHEMNVIKEHKSVLALLPPATMKTIFSDSVYRTPLLICIAMVVCQQACGIGPILSFSSLVMKGAGLTHREASLYSTIMSVFLVVMSFVCLMLIDVLGRRFLFTVSLCGLAIDLIFLIIVLTLAENEIVREHTHVITATAVVFIAAWYGIGLGTIPTVVTVDLFHHLARPVAVSVIVPIGWLLSFVDSLIFLPLTRKLGYYIFVIYICINLILYLFINMYLPETNGKTAKEIITLFYTIDVEAMKHRALSIYY